MDVQTLKSALDRRPFVPIRLHGSRGQSNDILKPEMAFLTRSTIVIGVDEGPDGVPEEFRLVPLAQVARLETI